MFKFAAGFISGFYVKSVYPNIVSETSSSILSSKDPIISVEKNEIKVFGKTILKKQ